MKDLVGKVIDGKYRLLRLIGEGGMGAVYEAEHIRINRKVAIKVMLPEMTLDRTCRDRFLREAESASAIGHPNIIEVHDVGVEEDGTAFIVMELLRGRSLEEVIVEQGVVEHSRAVAIAVQVLSALAEAHRKGIVHRDIKPDNIFIAIDGRTRQRIKVIDFGVAMFSESTGAPLGLTQPGTVLGTPYYLAPEQARGLKDLDHRIDIWSVGVVLYEMITGRRPFEGENYNEVMGKVLMEAHAPVALHAPDAPPGLIAVIDKALAKDRSERYQHASPMIEDLVGLDDRYRDEVDTQVFQVIERLRSLPPPPMIRPTGGREELARTLPAGGRRRSIAVAAGAALLLAALVVVIFVSARDGEMAAGTGENRARDRTDAGAEGAVPARSDFVRLDLTGAPDGASTSVNGAPLSVPGTLPRSDDPVTLRVEAFGYAPFEVLVVPSADLLMEVEMARLPRADDEKVTDESTATPGAAAKKPAPVKPSGPRKTDRKDGWMPSPFD
jgi:tRNA A-37 threonylcarbamoyl transferase component Bud32